jgi:hypothetical protein
MPGTLGWHPAYSLGPAAVQPPVGMSPVFGLAPLAVPESKQRADYFRGPFIRPVLIWRREAASARTCVSDVENLAAISNANLFNTLQRCYTASLRGAFLWSVSP